MYINYFVLICYLINCIVAEDTRIVGGQKAEQHSAYQVSLQAQIENDSSKRFHHFCSGAILTKKHILTAAHCLAGWKKERVTVVAGTPVWNVGGARYRIESIEIHDQFKLFHGYDIGLITLVHPLEFNENTTSIAFNDEYIKEDIPCILTGWGYTYPIRDPGFIPQWVHAIIKSYPKELQITEVQSISNEECQERFPGVELKTELCTYKWATGACAGDSGGPLVNLKRNLLYGVVSFGFVYCGGYTGFPDAYTRVSIFTSWIKDKIYK